MLEAASASPTTRLDDLSGLIDSACSCMGIVEFLRGEARQGHRIERAVDVVDPRVARGGPTGGTVFLTLDQHAGRVVASDGTVVERLTPSKVNVVLDLVARDGKLVITRLSSGS